MIKILIVSRSFYHSKRGGVVNYVKLLYENLKLKNYKLNHFEIGGKNIQNLLILPLIYIKQYFKFIEKIKEFKPEVIHINSSLNNIAIIRDFIFLRLSKKFRVPVVFFIHGWQKSLEKKIKSKFFKFYFKRNFLIADRIVVLSKDFKNFLVKLGIKSNNIIVSTTMVKSENYTNIEKEFKEPYKILFCSNLKREKGPFELIHAIPFINKKYPNVQFIFMGGGNSLEHLKKLSKKLNIYSNVKFVGFKTGKEKYNIFKESHIFVFPSYSEGFPTVVLEAMAAGLPIITTRVGGLKDVMIEGKQGLIMDSLPPNTDEIAKKILELIKNKKKMIEISQKNMEIVKQKYDVNIVSKQIEKIYLSLMYGRIK